MPTSARSEVTACWRSASIWALPCSTMRADSVWACSRISAMIVRALLASLLADARRLVPGVGELLLELGELGVGLGLLGLGRREAALDGLGALGEGLLEVRDHALLDGEEEQAEDDQREDDLDEVRQQRVELVLLLRGRTARAISACMAGPSGSYVGR